MTGHMIPRFPFDKRSKKITEETLQDALPQFAIIPPSLLHTYQNVFQLELMYCKPQPMTVSPSVGYECIFLPTPSKSIPCLIASETSLIISPARDDTMVHPTMRPVPFSQKILTNPSSSLESRMARSLCRSSALYTSTSSGSRFGASTTRPFSSRDIDLPTVAYSGSVYITAGTTNELSFHCPSNSEFCTTTLAISPDTCVNRGTFATQSPTAYTFGLDTDLA
mmetsp:Transcript_24193/g.43609  ORF Transcript_24193/g.43609 Transcript_24193/m.43609 type:complete len:223 (-) Transcript_24193:230-898(-)